MLFNSCKPSIECLHLDAQLGEELGYAVFLNPGLVLIPRLRDASYSIGAPSSSRRKSRSRINVLRGMPSRSLKSVAFGYRPARVPSRIISRICRILAYFGLVKFFIVSPTCAAIWHRSIDTLSPRRSQYRTRKGAPHEASRPAATGNTGPALFHKNGTVLLRLGQALHTVP